MNSLRGFEVVCRLAKKVGGQGLGTGRQDGSQGVARTHWYPTKLSLKARLLRTPWSPPLHQLVPLHPSDSLATAIPGPGPWPVLPLLLLLLPDSLRTFVKHKSWEEQNSFIFVSH